MIFFARVFHGEIVRTIPWQKYWRLVFHN